MLGLRQAQRPLLLVLLNLMPLPQRLRTYSSCNSSIRADTASFASGPIKPNVHDTFWQLSLNHIKMIQNRDKQPEDGTPSSFLYNRSTSIEQVKYFHPLFNTLLNCNPGIFCPKIPPLLMNNILQILNQGSNSSKIAELQFWPQWWKRARFP